MHIKDSGTLLLTEEDWAEYVRGSVSARLQEVADVSFEQLVDVVKSGNYRIIKTDGSETTRIEEDSGEAAVSGTEECSSSSGENGTED